MTKSIKTPLVFFPGTLCDERVFMPLWQALNTEGRSLEHKAFVPLQWAEDLAQMIALSEDRLDYFPSKIHLVGFSMGAYIAALVALAKPEKVASLTLLSGTGMALENSELQHRQALLTSIQKKQYKGMNDASIDAMLHQANQENSVMKAIIKDMAEDLGPSVLLAQTKATAKRKNVCEALSKARFVTHFLTGEQDKIATPIQVNEIVASTDVFNAKVFSNAGHMLPIEQPEALAAYLHKILE